MLVDFGPLRICLHDVGSICLVPPDPFYRYFRSGGSIYWSPGPLYGGPNPTWHVQIMRI